MTIKLLHHMAEMMNECTDDGWKSLIEDNGDLFVNRDIGTGEIRRAIRLTSDVIDGEMFTMFLNGDDTLTFVRMKTSGDIDEKTINIHVHSIAIDNLAELSEEAEKDLNTFCNHVAEYLLKLAVEHAEWTL